MGHMAELAAEEQQNESGLDLCEAWHHEQNSALAGTAQTVSAHQPQQEQHHEPERT